jgi:hypothetical protein
MGEWQSLLCVMINPLKPSGHYIPPALTPQDLGGLCNFGASIELVKVSEMFVFLNLTLHSFGPENFVLLVQIGKIQKGLIEENESYKMVYYP